MLGFRARLISILETEKRKFFYKKLLDKGDLVFDIGANHGNRTKIFHQIGAKVIAVEPNPKLAHKLIKKYKKKVTVVQKAIGSNGGKINLFINDSDVLSTTSLKWIDAVQSTQRFGGLENQFNKKIEVDMITLDSLLETYGIPKFIKIDTEGLEYEIIKTFKDSRIYSLSFEFAMPETSEDTLNSVKYLSAIGYHSFNISFGESMDFISNQKLNFTETIRVLENLPSMAWGDIYAFAS